MPYRRCGRSGIKLPAISLGLWNRFGDDTPIENQRAIIRRAFDLGITHIDLANNYGPPYGSAEINFGRILREDLRPYRDELIISTKAGYDMWPGPYGEWGSRKYLLSSLDQSLKRMGLEYVDIFYSHRFDPDTPLEETIGALDTAVRPAGRSTPASRPTRPSGPRRRRRSPNALGTRLLIHQPSYSLLNRWIEPEVLDACDADGLGIIAFSPLGQGMLTDRYLGGIPEDSRAAKDFYLKKDFINEENMARVRALNEIAGRRGQKLAQMALAWVLRDPRVTSRADRRLQRRAARDQRRRARQPRVHRRRAGGDRPARGRCGHQHLGAVELRLRRAYAPRDHPAVHAELAAGAASRDAPGGDRGRPRRARAPVPARAGDDGRRRPRRRDREPDRHRRDGRVLGRRRRAGVAGGLDGHAQRQLRRGRARAGSDGDGPVVKRGRSMVFSEVRVTEPDGRLVATGSVVQRLGA